MAQATAPGPSSGGPRYSAQPPETWDLTPEPGEVMWGLPLATDAARRRRYRQQLEQWMNNPFEPLPQRWADRAKQELNEDPARLRGDVETLRDLVDKEPHLLSRMDDHCMLTFLRSKRHEIQPAFKSLIKYYRMRKMNPDFFCLCLPSVHPELYKLKAITMLDGYDNLGRPICYFTADFSPSSINNCQFVQIIVHMLDFFVIDPRVQISGLTILVNLEKQTLGHSKLISVQFLKLMLQIFQGSFPVRMKSIIICHGSFLFRAMYSVLKPFIPEKFKTRIHILGGDVRSLTQFIPASVLPPELHGTAPALRDDILSERIGLVEDWLQEWYKNGYDDTADFSKSIISIDDEPNFGVDDHELQRRLTVPE